MWPIRSVLFIDSINYPVESLAFQKSIWAYKFCGAEVLYCWVMHVEFYSSSRVNNTTARIDVHSQALVALLCAHKKFSVKRSMQVDLQLPKTCHDG